MQIIFSADVRRRLVEVIEAAVANFTAGDWRALGTFTGCSHAIENHGRLLRSLSFCDPDYEGCAHEVLSDIVRWDLDNLGIIEEFIERRYGASGEGVSTTPSKSRVITFQPSVFEVPVGSVEPDLVACMMPFDVGFEPVFHAINNASRTAGFRCLRAKDIWDHQTVIQDVFSLIFRAHVVVCDFTGKNPNVFYEAGIAHTLGKIVIPLTQAPQDIPFDIQHHRYLHYLPNLEGLSKMQMDLLVKLKSYSPS